MLRPTPVLVCHAPTPARPLPHLTLPSPPQAPSCLRSRRRGRTSGGRPRASPASGPPACGERLLAGVCATCPAGLRCSLWWCMPLNGPVGWVHSIETWLPQPDADTTNLPVSPCSASAPRRIVDPVALQTTHCIELDDNEAALRWAGIACHTCKAAFKAWCQAGLSHWRPCCHAP